MKRIGILRTKYGAVHIMASWFLLFSFACSTTPNMTATPTPNPTDTPPAMSTPTPTATEQPTLTPSSTPTPAPTPMLVSKTGRVIRSEHFDSLSTLSFGIYGVGGFEVVDGHLVLTEKFSSEPTEDGEAAGRSIFSPQPGNVSVFLFKAEKGTYFGYHFELYSGTDYTGINLQQQGAGLQLNFWKGPELQLTLPVTKFQYNTWYYYSMQAQPDGTVTAQLWERDQPENVIFDHTVQLDPEWGKPGFTFVVTSYQGTMEIDEYQEIEPTDEATGTP